MIFFKPLPARATLCCLLVSAAHAATYSYTTIQYPGAAGTYPLSVNNEGVIAGYFFDSGFGGHGFVYSGGTFTQVDAGGGCGSTFVTGINDSGVLAGYCFPSKGGVVSFIDTNRAFTFFKIPGILDTYTQAINNQNVSVGWYITNANTIASFDAVDGKVGKEFTAPNSPGTSVYGINNSNVVVGSGIPGGGGAQQGFVAQRGSYTFTLYPNSYITSFNGVNDSLQIVGDESKVARGPVTAFELENGTFTDLIVPTATESVASGINNAGIIVGYYVPGSGLLSINAVGFIGVPQ